MRELRRGSCAFVGSGGRCGSRYLVELHHVVPFAKGGDASVENLGLRCAAHNRWHAEQDFAW